MVGVGIADALHVLRLVSMCIMRLLRRRVPYLDLVAAPAVHTQRLDLGDVGAELAVQRSTSYAQEYAQLIACKL